MEKAKFVALNIRNYFKENGIKVGDYTIEELDKVTGDLDGNVQSCAAKSMGFRKVDLETAFHVSGLKDIYVIFSGNPKVNVAYVKYIEGLSEFKELGKTIYDIERKYLMSK